MNPALLFLLARSVRGRLLRAVRLVRQPKYLIGLLTTLGWMSLWMLPWVRDRNHQPGLSSFSDTVGQVVPAIIALLGLFLALVATLWWLWPFGKPNIGLKEAELQLLLPSPLARRDIIRFAMLKSQPPILFGCVMMTIFARIGSWQYALQYFLALWFALTIWDLHAKGKRLWLGRQRELPGPEAARRWGVLVAGLVLFWAAIGWGLLAIDWGELASGDGLNGFLEAVNRQRERFAITPGGWALTPFVWLVTPLLINLSSPGVGERLLSFVGPLALLAVHERWVARSQTRFEEATLEAARRKTREVKGLARQARKSKRERMRAPFRLAPSGAPEVAVFWKNLILTRRTPWTIQLATILGIALAVALYCLAAPVPDWAFTWPLAAAMVMMVFLPMIGAGAFRNDFRADLTKVEAIRPWPVRGWKLVAAEVLSPATVAAVHAATGAAILVAFDVGTLWRSSDGPVLQGWQSLAESMEVARPLASILLVASVLPLTLSMGLFAATVQNLAALAFPGWVPLGMERKDVAQQLGTNLLPTLAQLLAMALALIPGLALAAAFVGMQTMLLGWPLAAWELPVVSILVAAPVLAITGVAVVLGGSLWERMDPSRELLGE